MKQLIDIPEEHYEWLKSLKTKGRHLATKEEAIANGFVLDGLTNGEVIQKMFPNAKILYIDEWEYEKAWVNVDFGHGEVLGFSLEWWNRKWGE